MKPYFESSEFKKKYPYKEMREGI